VRKFSNVALELATGELRNLHEFLSLASLKTLPHLVLFFLFFFQFMASSPACEVSFLFTSFDGTSTG